MTVGTVVRFDRAHGYGFVEPDDGGEDVFLHASLLEDDAKERVRAGTRVELQVTRSQRGPKAVAARVLDIVRPAATASSGQALLPLPLLPLPLPPVADRAEEELCDVLPVAEFAQKVTDTLIDAAPAMTGAQIIRVRQQLVDFARRNGWVEG